VLKLTQDRPTANTGKLSLVYKGDQAHSGFDNLAFTDAGQLAVVEDAGDLLHTQRKRAGLRIPVRPDPELCERSAAAALPGRGSRPSATLDSGFGSLPSPTGFQNDGDNEITGIHVSDGDAGVNGILGAKTPRPFTDGWRVFYTQQHGDNPTWEIIPALR
jgi:hypothetical protein